MIKQNYSEKFERALANHEVQQKYESVAPKGAEKYVKQRQKDYSKLKKSIGKDRS